MSSSITIQAVTESTVNADEQLLEWAQKVETDYDMRISLEANWNAFFKNVLLPTQKDDSDLSGSQDLDGIVKFDYDSVSGEDMAGLEDIYNDPRARLEEEMVSDPDVEVAPIGAKESNHWASAHDAMTSDATYDQHFQSVARGLIGLFKKTEIRTQADFQAEFDAGNNGKLDGADPTTSGEIRIVQAELAKFMGVSGEYGMNVFTSDQLKELFTACSETGRYSAVDVSGAGKYVDAVAGVHGFNVLALRQGDCLQVKATVYDATGGQDSQTAGLNKRVWLIDLKQSQVGRSDGNQYLE